MCICMHPFTHTYASPGLGVGCRDPIVSPPYLLLGLVQTTVRSPRRSLLLGFPSFSCFLWDFCALRAQPNQDLTTSPHRKIYLQSFWEMTTQEEEVGLQTKLWFGALFASDAKLTVLVMSSTNRISWCLSSLHGDGIGAHVNVGFDPLHHLQILISRLWGVAAAPRWNMVWDCRCVKLWCAWNP